MKSAFRNTAALLTNSLSISAKPQIATPVTLFSVAGACSSLPSIVSRSKAGKTCTLSSSLCYSSMAGGEIDALPSLGKQFEDFRVQLEESGNLRERIRSVAAEIESITRLMQAGLLLVHQSRPLPEILEKAKAQTDLLKELYSRLAEVLRECPGQYYRYHGDWRSETQSVVCQIAFVHWLETGTLLTHLEAVEKLGLTTSNFDLDIEDYLVGICFLSNEMPRYVVNQVLAGNYNCPKKVLKFLTELNSAFRMLNLRNDFLRKKFDGMKYDLKRVEEVYYDMKIRNLVNGESTAEDKTQGES